MRNRIAFISLILKLIDFAIDIEVAIIYKLKLYIIENLSTKDKKQLKLYRKLVCI